MNKPQPDAAPGRGRIDPATGRGGADPGGRSFTVTRRRVPDQSASTRTNPSARRPECLMLFPTSSDTSNRASSKSSGGIARAPKERRTSARDSGLAGMRRSNRQLGPAGDRPFALTIGVYPLDGSFTPLQGLRSRHKSFNNSSEGDYPKRPCLADVGRLGCELAGCHSRPHQGCGLRGRRSPHR